MVYGIEFTTACTIGILIGLAVSYFMNNGGE